MFYLTLSSKQCYNSLILNSIPCIHGTNFHLHDLVTRPAGRMCPRLLFSCRPLTKSSFFTRQEKPLLKRLCSTSPPEKDDNQALEAVLKFYAALKNRNLQELSFLIAEECRCACNFVPFLQSFQGKKQVLAFFYYLIRTLGNNIEIVVQPTTQDGMTIGVAWKLEWNKIHMPLGKGFSLHICQTYQGKVIIRNLEMSMEPLLYLQPIRLAFHLKTHALVSMPASCLSFLCSNGCSFFALLWQKVLVSLLKVVEKISSYKTFPEVKDKRILYVLLALLLIVALLLFQD